MENDNRGPQMVAAFYYVRDVYRNISRMLLSCDSLMEANSFSTNPRWDSISKDRILVLSQGNISDTWMPYFAVRQYFKNDNPLDFITIGAVVWDFHGWLDTPLCLASRMLVHDPSPNELMWISVVQVWDTDAKPDGKVHLLSEASSKLPDNLRRQIPQYVQGGRILSVACPLIEVCDIDAIASRLINPLLLHGLKDLPLQPVPPVQAKAPHQLPPVQTDVPLPVTWSRDSFFQRLRANWVPAEVEAASQIVALAHEQGLTPYWVGGKEGGVFWPMLAHGGNKLCPFSLNSDGHVTIRIEELKEHQPFIDTLKRSELQERLSKIPGVSVSGESRPVSVTIPCSALAQSEALVELLSAVKWLVEQIKLQRERGPPEFRVRCQT